METRVETHGEAPELHKGILTYWEQARKFAEQHYADVLEKHRRLRPTHVGPEKFFSEYVWCVYVSGFNSKVVDQKIHDLLRAFERWDVYCEGEWQELTWSLVSRIVTNRRKFDAVLKTKALLQRMGWEAFQQAYLGSAKDIGKLPFMGPTMRHHLARNIGLDAVKPDRHLVRLSTHFGFDSPLELCRYLSKLSGERIGVVDLVLFYAASTYGTRSLM